MVDKRLSQEGGNWVERGLHIGMACILLSSWIRSGKNPVLYLHSPSASGAIMLCFTIWMTPFIEHK